MSTKGFKYVVGDDIRLSKHQISEKVKFFGGDHINVLLDSDAAGIENIVPGSIVEYDSDTGKWKPARTGKGASGCTPGYGANMDPPGAVKISVSFWENAADHANMLAVNSLGSEGRMEVAYNITAAQTGGVGDPVAIKEGKFICNSFASLDAGIFIIGFLERAFDNTAGGYPTMYINTAGAGFHKETE